MILFLIIILFASSIPLSSQMTHEVQLPVIIEPEYSIYIHTDGKPDNSGDSLTPLDNFQSAILAIDKISSHKSGDIYAEVVFFPGTYTFPISQYPNQYEIGERKLNISVRGINKNVTFDGNNIELNAGEAMVRLMGSNISVKNLNINYSNGTGVRFGFNWSGNIINPHDILIENVEVTQTKGHGIIVGVSPLNSANPLDTIPKAERFLIKNCRVFNSVNFNKPEEQWGSAIKFHNIRHGTAINCISENNSGEGINSDFCEFIDISNNVVSDNYANIYLDKVEKAFIRNNLIYNKVKDKTAILLGMEPFAGFISNYYIKDISIYNNIILNTSRAILYWQGTYSAIQTGHFYNIYLHNNTIIGKQATQGVPISFSYSTFLGQPSPNIKFLNNKIFANIISIHKDSLNGNRLFSSSVKPQPQLELFNNLWNQNPIEGFNEQSDEIRDFLPTNIEPDSLHKIIPSKENLSFQKYIDNNFNLEFDYFNNKRSLQYTQVGAIEFDSDISYISNLQSIKSKLRYYPTPVTDRLIIDSNEPIEEIFLFDIIGKNYPIEYKNNQNQIRLNTVNIPKGYYIIKVNFERDNETFFFIKE